MHNVDRMYLSLDDADKREQILFGRSYDEGSYSCGGTCHFDDMTVAKAEELMRLGYMDPEETQNDSPTVQQFVDFIKGYGNPDSWRLHGYAVSPLREDVRVSVEGIESVERIDTDALLEFAIANRYAAELLCSDGMAYCWYD